MTADRRLERDLAQQLTDLYVRPLPDYRDDLIGRIAATPQRPAWSFPGRWFPMSVISERIAAGPHIPWRAVGVLALLILAVLAAAILAGGGQQRRVLTPFGPAGNGVIAFTSGGDLYVGDPVTGETRLVDTGNKTFPLFSPDGTQIAYVRDFSTGSEQLPVDIYVADADGTDRQRINFGAIADVQWIYWTPDSRRLAVIRTEQGVNQLDLFDATEGGSAHRVPTAAGLDNIEFRPPEGREILFRALVGGKYGLFVMDADGTNVRTLVEPTNTADLDMDLSGAVYSADGSRIFYQRWFPDSIQLWVMNADGSDPHEFIPEPGPAWDGQAAVSPDGKWIAYRHFDERSPDTETATSQLAVARADGIGAVIQTGPKLPGSAHWIWAPDSSKILMYPNDDSSRSAYLLDPNGGPWTQVPWESDGDLDWQRVAP